MLKQTCNLRHRKMKVEKLEVHSKFWLHCEVCASLGYIRFAHKIQRKEKQTKRSITSKPYCKLRNLLKAMYEMSLNSLTNSIIFLWFFSFKHVWVFCMHACVSVNYMYEVPTRPEKVFVTDSWKPLYGC